MTSATDAQQLEAIAKFWGHAYTFSYDHAGHPDEPHGAHRRDGKGTLRSATPALLLDAIKDDLAFRPFTPDLTP